MSYALRSSLVSLRPYRWWYVLPAAAAVLSWAATSARASAAGAPPPEDLLTQAALIHQFAALAGVLLVGLDAHHRLLGPAVRNAPSRHALVTARLAASALLGAVIGLLGTAAAAFAVLTSSQAGDLTVGDVAVYGARLALGGAVLGLIGSAVAFAVGEVVIVIIGVVLVWPALEAVARGLNTAIVDLLPYAAVGNLSAPSTEDVPSAASALLVASVWVVMTAAAAYARFHRADLAR